MLSLMMDRTGVNLFYQSERAEKEREASNRKVKVEQSEKALLHWGGNIERFSDPKKYFKSFTYGKQSKRPLRFYGGAIFLSLIRWNTQPSSFYLLPSAYCSLPIAFYLLPIHHYPFAFWISEVY